MSFGYRKSQRKACRSAAGLLILFALVSAVFFGAGAEDDSLSLSVSWIDVSGETIVRTARPLGYEGYENAWWVMVDGAALDSLTLHISGLLAESNRFEPENGSLLASVSDAGSDLLSAPWIDIISVGDHAGDIRFRLYISASAEYPVLSPVRTASVPVKYLDEANGLALIEDGVAECAVNDVTTVTAADIPGYVPLNTSTNVFTDPNGVTSPTEVVFYYRVNAGPVVTIRYVDAAGGTISPDATVECGIDETKVIRAIQINGYALEGPDTATVNVNAQGIADRNEIVFTYRPLGPVTVTVRYLNSVTGQEIAEADRIPCPLGETAVFRARTIAGYIPDGSDTEEMYVGINGETEKTEIAFYYSLAGTPTVRISYLFEDGSHAAEDEIIPCQTNMETPISARNFPGYRVIGDAVRTVKVDGNGKVEPAAIEFVYTPSSEPAVTVRYVDQNTGEEIAPSASAVCAINSITPVQAETVTGYAVSGQAVRYVYVDAQGKADTDEVVFLYVPESIPQVIWVRVVYREITDGTLVFSSSEPFDSGSVLTVYADTSRIPAEYELSDDARKTISVQPGAAEETEVVFWLRKKTVNMITIPVFYMDESGREVASPGIAELVEGNNPVYAQPFDLMSGYALSGDSVQYVIMDETGQLSRSEVVFTYYLTVTPTPSPSPTAVPYVVTDDSFYAHTTKDSVYFRSSPGTQSMDNVIRQVNRSEVIFVAGSLSNELGEKWYQVDIGGTGGFINANVIAPMTQDEVNALFGFTPTPVPTPIPDGAPIERWGKVNRRQVNFRRDSSRSAKVIDQLNTGAQVWVFRSLTVDGTQWYYIRSSGRDGYVMKEFVDLMSERESEEYQLSLRTPMSTRTPDPTRMATSVVTSTPVPTPSPTVSFTPAPTPTMTPEPYKGYAVTRNRTTMYDGPGGEDVHAVEEIGEKTLVLVLEHDYSDVHWDYVELADASGLNRTGFIPDSELEYISNDMVGMYLNAQQQNTTPTAIPTQIPQQKHGFARTVGDNVALRAYADTNAQIYSILAMNTVVVVNGQEYTYGQTWDMVNYGSLWGYIREDQLQMLSEQEVMAYLESLRTPTPLPEATPTAVPVTGESLTSYGYVIADKVNLRSGPSRSSEPLRLLEKNAFALVSGTLVNAEGETWHHIIQSGNEGYIMGDYFKVLSVDELAQFLGSEDYRNASDNAARQTDASAQNIQALEDYNREVWRNPAVNVSYEPFTVTSASPAPTAEPASTPTPAPRSTYGIGGVVGTPSVTAGVTDAPLKNDRRESGASALGIVLAGGSVVLLGSAAYIYHIHRKNERRRRAVREQQARQAARAASYPRTTKAAGSVRDRNEYASEPTRRMSAAPFMPPSGAPSKGAAAFGEEAEEDSVWRKETRVSDSGMEGTRSYASFGEPAAENDDYDPWKKNTRPVPPLHPTGGRAEDKEPEQRTRIVPQVSERDIDLTGRDLEESDRGPDAEKQVRHRRSDRYRNQGTR